MSRITPTAGKRQVALPDELSFKEWTEDLNISLRSFNIPLYSSTEEQEEEKISWKDWVYNFISLNPKTIISLPSGEDWREWARFFITDINSR